MAGLGRQQGRLDGLVVTHLTDQNDVGILAQSRAQRGSETVRIDVELALIDDRFLVAVEELDRILDRQMCSARCC